MDRHQTKEKDFSRALGRRDFLRASIAVAMGAILPIRAAEPKERYRAAVIGHTGNGNYGHQLDVVFNDRDDIEVVGVADPDAAGRAKAADRCKAARQYADYREMLAVEKPQLVSIAPRTTGERFAMASAALKAGAHIYVEKPFARTIGEGHAIVGLAERNDLKVAVAHQMRLAPNIIALKKALDAGLIGDLLEIRAQGKQDHRAGGEDLIVLGVHLFDLMRFFAGDPSWCSARILERGRDIVHSGRGHFVAERQPTEDIGPIAGDEVFAHFAFPQGVNGTFVSTRRAEANRGVWGLELAGSEGALKIQMEMIPTILHRAHHGEDSSGRPGEWRLWQPEAVASAEEHAASVPRANARVVDDWLRAIAEDREPTCSGRAALAAVEMAHAVFTAGLSGGRVSFPFQERRHPLE